MTVYPSPIATVESRRCDDDEGREEEPVEDSDTRISPKGTFL